MMKYPVCDRRVNVQPPQSASKKADSSKPPADGRKIPCPGVDFKYRKIRMAASMCGCRGSDKN